MANLGTIEVEINLKVASEVTDAMARALSRILTGYIQDHRLLGRLYIDQERIGQIIREEIQREIDARTETATDD